MGNEMKYFKLYLDEVALWQEELSMEEIGYLLVAATSYMRDETIMEVPQNVRFAFADQRRKVDMRKEAYKSKVENGKQGGITKAENEKKRKATGYKPPSKKQFKAIIAQMVESNEISEEDFSSRDIDNFFTQLRTDQWTIKGTPIRSDVDLMITLRSKFGLPPYEPKRSLFFSAFEYVFAEFPNLRDNDNNSLAEDVVSDFFDTYDKSNSMFVFNGKKYPQSKWEDALHSFIEHWIENIPP